ncbi:MAG TPA: 30S ribosomal protein S12 methylthiotransferase RimO [Bacteroidales bacterium]|nr:30S ribosomal protein S12 methylthiotransferase RimO [Bacteroidales bacterium]HPT01188.1 30S ribosomal protein S12 methylthiotransferase RimO [Bacteroidales bacterium]
MKPHTIRVVTLGCAKNTVDSEKLMAQLNANNIRVIADGDKGRADTVIINTCGFINDAKEESVDTILEFIEAKKQGKIKDVFVMGCLSERFKGPLQAEIPEVDEYFGVNDLGSVVRRVGAEYRRTLLGERLLTTPKHYAYLKIAEGCNRRCSFCAIPNIRGRHISRPIPEILEEARLLAAKGVKELLLISQDLTYYGIDTHQKQLLPELVEQLSDLKLFSWIRLHYLFPATFPDRLLEVIASRPDVCNYIDIPLQHIESHLLSSMRRGVTREETIALIKKFRKALPNAAIRTAFIVGYPGETEEDFAELKDFLIYSEFDRVGVFTYSHEEDTHAFGLKDDVPEEVKQQRASEIMEMQQEISMHKNHLKIGKTFKVLIDRLEGEFYVGRTEFDSPEVDNEVLIEVGNKIKIGEFYNVKIKQADEFDLYGEIADF